MTMSLISAANWPIVGQICWVLGKVMNFIYTMLDNILATDTGLVGWSIIIYTILVYTCMLPMTINQQRTTKMQAVINPEVQAIQKKYKNKKLITSLYFSRHLFRYLFLFLLSIFTILNYYYTTIL